MKNSKFIFIILLSVLFVVGQVSAQKDFDPEFEKVKSRVSYVPGIKVIRGETQVIVSEHERFCPNGTIFKFNNGD
uniref:hypothetical protein n=1 Tax=Mariniphaga sediminis TaxID=1628158 RepID=UPI0035636FF1